MEFASDMHKEVYEKVAGLMKDIFGDIAQVHPEQPAFGVIQGSALANIVVAPMGDGEVVIAVRSWVVSGADVNADLMHYLLRENDKFTFGGFGLDDRNSVFFQHAIVGSTCDREELKASVMAVALMADHYDDEIKARAGGQSAKDTAMEFASASSS